MPVILGELGANPDNLEDLQHRLARGAVVPGPIAPDELHQPILRLVWRLMTIVSKVVYGF